MNEHKGVNASRRSTRRDCRRAIGIERHLVADCEVRRYKRSQDTGCQVDARDGVICTCRTKSKRHETRYFSIVPEQVYAYHGVRSYTNIGVGDVKTIHRRKVRKIYLPAMDDRGVGSSEVSSVMIRKHSNTADSYYVPKTTSSKCVGGFWQPVVNVLSEKLSAVVKCIYATTGFEVAPPNHQKTNIEIGNNTEHKKFATTTTQVECEVKVKAERSDRSLNTKEQGEIPNDKSEISPKTKASLERKEDDKFSSDSLVQNVHDLEHPRSVSQKKHSKASLHPMEKKVEKEYRQMFASTKSKNPSLVKSKSLLRRRFEALRRGHKKEDAKKKDVDTVSSSPANIGHKAIKDEEVSIVFDLPFLEAESNYDEKPYAPANSPPTTIHDKASFRPSLTGVKKCLDSTNNEENEFEQGVSGVDKNLEEDTRTATKISSDTIKDKIYDKTLPDNKDADKKTGGMKFPFFKKRSKDKAKSEKNYKTKKGVPANCEVKDVLVHTTLTNSDAYNTLPPNSNADDTDNHEDIQRKAWFRKFLTSNIHSRDSVKIRWNNKTYATSSSTVFRIVDNVYKETGIVIRSKSDIQMNKSSYKSSGKNRNFVNQYIEAWMVPKTITDMPTLITMNIFSTAQKEDTSKKEKVISKQKRSMDKTKTFSLNMRGRVVLRSNHKMQEDDEKTSNLLRIDIPDDYFSESCDEENRGTSDEKIYNIVEYETLKSNSDFKKKSNFDTGDHAGNDVRVSIDKKDSQEIESRVLETIIKNPPVHKDVLVQNSIVDFPKRCDVIEVGVLTQKDVIDFKPISKLEDDLFGYESGCNHFNPTGCEFAQSYLQEYYRQWMPLDVVQSSWRGSQSRCRRSSESNSNTTLTQRNGSKSCPNVCEEYHPSTLISPSHSFCSHCHNLFDDEYRNKILYGYVTSLVKSGKCKEVKANQATSVDKVGETEVKKPDANSKKKKDKKENKDIRVLPKDSVEVFKRRQLYALSNKGQWLCPHKPPYSVPSLADEAASDCLDVIKKPCPFHQENPCEKRVCLADDGANVYGGKLLEGIITYKGASCGTRKNDQPKKILKLGLPCEMPSNDPACKKTCEKKKKPPCDKNTEPCPPIPTPTLQCQIPPPEPACKKNGETVKKPPCDDKNTEPCPPSVPPTVQCEIQPPEPACKKNCETMKKPPCDKNTEPCPPSAPPTLQCEIPPPEPACKKNCETMKKPPCDKHMEPCPPSAPPTLQCEIPPPEPACKTNCETMKKPPCDKHMEPCPPRSLPTLQCQIPPSEPACKKNCEKMKKPPCDKNTEPCPPSPPPTLQCEIPPPEPACKKSCEKMKKPPCKVCSNPPSSSYESPCPTENDSSSSNSSEPKINYKFTIDGSLGNTCRKHTTKFAKPPDPACLKNCEKMKKPPCDNNSEPCPQSPPPVPLCNMCMTPSPPETGCDKNCEKLKKQPRNKSKKPSPPSEPPCPSECNALTCQFSERSINCMISFEEPAGYDTRKKSQMKSIEPSKMAPQCEIPSPPDHEYQKQCNKTKLPYSKRSKPRSPPSPPSESPCPSESDSDSSKSSEHNTNCMVTFDVSTSYDTCKKLPMKCPKHPDYSCQKRNSMPCLQSPGSESPSPSERNAPATQFPERSTNCMMSYEEPTGYDTSKIPPKCAKPFILGPKYDVIVVPRDSAYQTNYAKTKKPPKDKKLRLPPPGPPSESPCQSECNASPSQFSERSTNCMMSFEESSYDDKSNDFEEWTEYDTSRNSQETGYKPYKERPKHDIIAEPPDRACKEIYENTKMPQSYKKSKPYYPSPPSESPCQSESPSQFSDRSINCSMSFEASTGYECYDTSINPQEKSAKHYKLAPKHDIIAEPPDRAYQKIYDKIEKPRNKTSKPSPPSQSPPSESPCPSECNEPAPQFSDRSINCMMPYEELSEDDTSKNLEESMDYDMSKNPPEPVTKPYKVGPKYDVVVIPPNSEYQTKNEINKKPPKEKKLRLPPQSPPSESPCHSECDEPASQFSERSINCMMSFEESKGHETSKNPPEQGTRPYKLSPKYDIVVIPPNSEYDRKNENTKEPQEEDKKSKPSPPQGTPRSSKSSTDSRFSECNTNCMISYEGCHKPLKMGPQYDVVVIPPDSANQKKSDKTKKAPSDESSMPSPASPKQGSKFPTKSSAASLISDCMITYQDIPGFSTCNIPPMKCAKPQKKCNTIKPTCDKSRMPCPPSPLASPCPSRSNSACSVLSACTSPPPCPVPKCSTESPSYCKESCPEVRLTCPSPNDSFCVKKYTSKMEPLLGCKVRPPPKCSRYPLPSCSPPPTCKKYPPPSCSPPPTCKKYPPPSCSPPPTCKKYPPPSCSPPPMCKKYPPPSCSPPPMCKKYPPSGCLPPPKCMKYPSCLPPPKCTKYPSCLPPPTCNKYPPPSCSPPPMCNKYPPPSCLPPPMCSKYPPPSCSPPPMCNKYPPPGCLPPPKCNKYPPPGCFPPPKCNKYPRPGCFPPPKCTKLPGCFKPPKCQKYIKTDCMGNKKISCKPTSEKGCDPFRKCGSQMFPPPSPCPRPMSKRCVLPPRPCRFPPHLCRPHSAPICPTLARRTSCLNDPGPCRLCAESYPCPVSPTPLCPSKLSDCFKCPKEGLFLKKLPSIKKGCIPEFPCKKYFDVCSPKKPCVKTTFVEDGSGRNQNYGYCLPPTKKPCLEECPIKRAVDRFEPCTDEIGWIKLMHKNKLRAKRNKSFVENCPGPNTVDEEKVPPRKATTIKNKCTNKRAPVKTMTFIDKCPARVDEARSVHSRLLGDMYQPSFCQRVSTKDAQIVNTLPKISSQSLDNLVEIQFKMKITQGNKITEINLGKDGEEKEMPLLKSSCRDDYVVNNTATSLQEQVGSSDMTNGVNIHIVINNFKRKDKKLNLTAETDQDEERSKIHDDFANKICQKFHTVSTAYSDGIQSDLNRKDAFSAQRATWNLTGSSEKSKTQPSGNVRDLSHNKDIKMFTTSQNLTSVTALDNKFDTATEEKSCSNQKVGDAKSEGAEVKEDEEKEISKVIYNADELDKEPSINKTNLCNNASSDKLKTALNHGEKKNSLKMVVEKAGNNVSKFTKLFKAIVKTSESSENAEMTATDNDLPKDITLASTKPNLFRNTDSMNNYYKQSSMTSDNEDCCYKYYTSRNRDNKCVSGTCVCTTLATKLNVLGQGGCPCSNPVKTYVDIETNCDRTDRDISHVLSNSPSDYLDVATQKSRLFISRANSANVSNNNFTVKDNNVLSNITNMTESKQNNPGTYISSHHTKVKSFSVNISPVLNQIGIEKECRMKKFHRETIPNISDEDKIIANMKPKRDCKECEEIIAHMEPMRIKVETTEDSAEEYFNEKSSKAIAPADLLQSFETKKAVLEMYTERTICDGRKHLVAKLPKFTIERASEIIKYEKICKRSFVMSFES